MSALTVLTNLLSAAGPALGAAALLSRPDSGPSAEEIMARQEAAKKEAEKRAVANPQLSVSEAAVTAEEEARAAAKRKRAGYLSTLLTGGGSGGSGALGGGSGAVVSRKTLLGG